MHLRSGSGLCLEPALSRCPSLVLLPEQFNRTWGNVLKVFISWSGNSKAVAKAIYDALPTLFDDAHPWISTENPSGSIWLPEIDKELSDTDFGIICVSKKNQHAPWLNFEAGALSRKVDAKRELMPVLLLDFAETGDVKGPVTGFQMKMATLDGFFAIMKDLNKCELGPKIKEDILRTRVEAAWPKIDAEVQKVRASADSTQVQKRPDEDKFEEILETVRSIASTTSILAHQRWGGTTDLLSQPDMSALARAIGDVGRATGVGEMSISFPDKKRVLIATQRPINETISDDMERVIEDLLGRDIEVAFQPMKAEQVERVRQLVQMSESH